MKCRKWAPLLLAFVLAMQPCQAADAPPAVDPRQGQCQAVAGGVVFDIVRVRLGSTQAPQMMPPRPDVAERMRATGVLAQYASTFAAARAAGMDRPGPLRAPLTGVARALVLLVDFSDNTGGTPRSHYADMLFSSGTYLTGSMRDFYAENSYATLDLQGDVGAPASGDWFRAPQTYAYYAYNQSGWGPYPHNSQRLTEDIVLAADPYVDFSVYDFNKDGYVDALFIVHAGPGGESTGDPNDIWSHAWGTSYSVPVDGVHVSPYSIEPEDGTVGVFCHEVGHTFGLPDLYDYDYDSAGVGMWTLMAGGSWKGGPYYDGTRPSHLDAWCKSQLGWITPEAPSSNIISASIPQVETNSAAYRLWTNGATGPQYFMVENRQGAGFDAGLPGYGLLIYHIDETQPNNDDQNHYMVAVEQADGKLDLENNANDGDAGDPWPGSTNKRTFDVNTTPNTRSYAATDTQVAVKTISNSGQTMTADLYVTNPSAPRVTVLSPNGGESWSGSHEIRWSATDASGGTAGITIDLYYSNTPGGPWVSIAAGQANDGTYTWNTAQVTDGKQYLVRVVARAAGLTGEDRSDAVFDVDNTPPYTSGHSPGKGATDVPAWTSIYAEVKDALQGVARASIVMTVQGVNVTALCTITPIQGGYSVLYDPPQDFTPGQQVSVTLDASDKADAPNKMAQDAYSFTIGTRPQVRVISPNGGESWGGPHEILWTAADATGDPTGITIDLYYRTSPSAPWVLITSGEANDGTYSWETTPLPDGNQYSVRVVGTKGGLTGEDQSDGVFDLDNTPPYTANHAPAKGATKVSPSTNIYVEVKDALQGVSQQSIHLTVEGVDVTAESSVTPVQGGYAITYDPPQDFAPDQVVDVTVDAADRADSPNVMPQDAYSFTIGIPPQVTLIAPNGAEVWGGVREIRWFATDADSEPSTLVIDIYCDPKGTGAWTPLATGEANDGTYTWDTTALPDGIQYLIQVVATDADGFQAVDQSDAAFEIDNTAPTSHVSPLNRYTITLEVALTWGPDEGVTDIGTYTIQVYDENAATPAWQDIPTLTEVTLTSGTFTAQEGHTYHFRSRATDQAGNQETDLPAQGDTKTTVDTIPPTLVKADDEGSAAACLEFSKALDKATAEQPAGYQVTPDLAVTAAAQEADNPERVHLTFDRSQAFLTDYIVTVSGVTDVAGNPVQAEHNQATWQRELPHTFLPGRWMITVPVLLDGSRSPAVLQANSLARWKPDEARYVADAGDPWLNLGPGCGLWARWDALVSPSFAGHAPPATEPFQMQVVAGWNQIGNPYHWAALPWSTLQQANAALLGECGWAWTGSGYVLLYADASFGAQTQMEPWQGYWLWATQNGTITVPLPPAQAPDTSAQPEETTRALEQGGWYVRLVAQAGALTDSFNVLGVTTRGRDQGGLRVAEPPATDASSFLTLYFLSPTGQGRDAVDLRSPFAGTKTWEFVVETDLPDTDVTLTWPSLAGVPRDLDLVLIDGDTGAMRHMRTTTSYPFRSPAQGGARRFRIAAGNATGAGLVVSALTATPTRGGTVAISCALSRAAAVEVTVYTLAGEVAARPVEKAQAAAGTNTFYWDSRGAGDALLPPGLYLCEVRAYAEDGQVARAVRTFQLSR